MQIGDRVRIKAYHPWQKRFHKKVGEIVYIREVTPSKKVRDGLIYYVMINVIDRKTGQIGVTSHFISKELIPLDIPEQT